MWPMLTRLPQNTTADDRRAHAGAFGPRLRGLVDALVGRGDLLLQQQRRVREAARDVDLRQLAAGAQLRQHAVADDVDRDAARDLAGVVAAHAVGEHRDAGVGVDEDRVLVVRADHPRVGQDGAIERRAFGHRVGSVWMGGRGGPRQAASLTGRRHCCERCACTGAPRASRERRRGARAARSGVAAARCRRVEPHADGDDDDDARRPAHA